MVIQKIKDDKLYDADGSYLGHVDIVYGGSRKGGVTSKDNSEAIANPQPSKEMNANSNKIDGANPSSPSTNPATRSAEYNLQKGLMDGQGTATGTAPTTNMYNTSNINGTSSSMQNMSNLMNGSTTAPTTTSTKNTGGTGGTGGLDLTLKGNFDTYQPIDRQSQSGIMQQYYLQANNDIQATRRGISKLMLQEDALNSKSGNLNEVTTLIDAVENAYDRGVFDTQTIANQLGVSPEAVSLIQQGKANELVKLNEDYVKEQMKGYERQRSDLDVDMQRTMENYNLQKTNLDAQYNSAVQTLKRNLFDAQRASKTGSAIAGVSGSEYALNVIQAKHDQAMGDLDNNYMYSSIKQKQQYTRAMEDYNKAIERLSEDFDSDLKNIQASVLQQFQEIDNKIGLSTQQLAQIYGTLEQNVLNAKTSAVSSYMQALADGETNFANAIAQISGLDTTQFSTTVTEGNFKYNPITTQALTGGLNTFIDNLGDAIEKHAKIRGGQCGALGNDYLQSFGYGKPIGDSKSSKLNLKNSSTPKVGSLAIWDKTGTEAGDKYGHVAIVTSVNDDGTITVLEQNANTGLRYHKYKASNVYGYFDPTIGSEKQITQTSESGKEERDYSGLTEQQRVDVDQIATQILGSTQAAKDVNTHNAIAQMMRDGISTDKIISQLSDRQFGQDLEAYPELQSVAKYIAGDMKTSSKTDFLSSIKDAINNKNPNEAFSFVKATLRNQMDANTKKSTQATELLLQHTQEIEDLYNQYIEKGGETSWLSGTYEEFLHKFGKTSDPELLELYNKIQRSIMTFRHDISGAAFTESEAKQYEDVFPNTKDTMESFMTKVKSIKDLATKDNEYYYDSMLGGTGKYGKLQEELSKVRTVEKRKEQEDKDIKNTYSIFSNLGSMLNNLKGSFSSTTGTGTSNSVFTNSGIYVSNGGNGTLENTTFKSHMG